MLLIGAGLWYNLFPLCYFRTLTGEWQRNLLASPAVCPGWLADARRREAIRPNHTATAQPLHFNHNGHGDYAYTRQVLQP